MRVLTRKGHGFNRVVYGRSNRQLLTRSRFSEQLDVWDLATFEPVRRIAPDDPGARLLSCLWQPGGRRFLEVQGYWPEGEEWPDAAGLRPEHAERLPKFGRVDGWLSFGPDGRSFLRESYGPLYRSPERVALWDLDGNCVRTFVWSRRRNPKHAAFSPDGRVVVMDCHPAVALWDVASGAVLGEMEDAGSVEALAYAPDGQTVATAAGRLVRLWDVETRSCQERFPAFRATVQTVAYSPNGRLLAAGSRDGTVRLWEVATGRQVAAHDWRKGDVEHVAFAPDGQTCAAACKGKAVVVWDVDG
jgi:WD40 repeat protein